MVVLVIKSASPGSSEVTSAIFFLKFDIIHLVETGESVSHSPGETQSIARDRETQDTHLAFLYLENIDCTTTNYEH